MALPTVTGRPEKTVNDVLSRWNAVSLPLIYDITNTKWPTNSEDTIDTINSVADDNGFAKIVLAASSGYTEKLWVEVTGTTAYDGIHRVKTVSGVNITIDFPFTATDTGSLQVYYNNYTTLIRVYAGIDPAHDHAASKPITLIGTIEQRPDTDNITLADVRDYVKNKLNSNYDMSQSSWPNDLNGWTDFYIAFAERYDSISGSTVVDFTSNYTNDLDGANIIYCKAINGALQFGYEFGGNVGEYVVNGSLYNDLAKWLTFFDRSKILDYNNFDISIILDVDIDPYFPVLEISQYDQNDNLLLVTEQTIEDQDYGLYRIPLSFEFEVLTTYMTIQVLQAGFEESVIHNIDVDVDCFPFEGAPDAPLLISATLIADPQIDLVWAEVDNATGYEIFRGVADGSKSQIDSVGEVLTYSDTDAKLSGTEYCYAIRAIGKGVSDFSNEECANIPYDFGNAVVISNEPAPGNDWVALTTNPPADTGTTPDTIFFSLWFRLRYNDPIVGADYLFDYIDAFSSDQAFLRVKFEDDGVDSMDFTAILERTSPPTATNEDTILTLFSRTDHDNHHLIYSLALDTDDPTRWRRKIYIDGVLKLNSLMLGARSQYFGNFARQFVGSLPTAQIPLQTIGEYMCAINTPLTDDNVSQIWGNGVGSNWLENNVTSANKATWFKFNESSGTSAADSGGGGYTGTLTNFANTGYGTQLTLTGTPSPLFTIGETVTGGTTGATAKVVSSSGTDLEVEQVFGKFEDSETVTSATTSETIAVGGVLIRAWDKF